MAFSETSKNKLPPLKKVLVIGSGGRENAIAWAMKRSNGIQEVWVAPGNGGTERNHECKRLAIKENDLKGLIEKSLALKIDLVVIGPEAPLANGLADELRDVGLTVFGPGSDGAKLEASKSWAKKLMIEAKIPTAKYWAATSETEALSIVNNSALPLIVKADGLASGKGVTVPNSIEETKEAIKNLFKGKFGKAGRKIVLEEKLEGPEISVFALCDGERMVILPTAQDHKRLKEGDLGPNTGGMGAYAPAPHLDKEELTKVQKLILEPTLKALSAKGINYRGVIYAGLMLTKSGPKVIEFNCRFGDPECQTLMPLLGPELAIVLQGCALGSLDKAPELSIFSQCSVCIVAAASGYPENPRSGDPIQINLEENESTQLFIASSELNEDGILCTSGGRVLSIVTQSETFKDALEKAYIDLGKITFKGITFRKDIGSQVINYDS